MPYFSFGRSTFGSAIYQRGQRVREDRPSRGTRQSNHRHLSCPSDTGRLSTG